MCVYVSVTLLFSQLLQLFPHIRILKLRVVVTADVRRLGVSGGRRGGVAVHRRGMSARRVAVLLAFAATRAPQEGHGPLHEVAAAVLGRRGGGSRRSWAARGGGADAAAVLVRRAGVVVMGQGARRLGPGDVARRDIGAGRRRGPVDVRRGGAAVTAVRFGRSRGIGCGRRGGFVHGRAVLVFPVRALGLGLAVRARRTTRGRRRTAGAATLLAFL